MAAASDTGAATSSGSFSATTSSLDSAEYAAAFNEVEALGRATGSTRTPDETLIARFWADGAGTYTPPGHWNQIAEQVATTQGNSPMQLSLEIVQIADSSNEPE